MLKPHMEALILSVLHIPPEKHPTQNGVIAGQKYAHIGLKQNLLR